MLISVILPAYNAEKYLSKAIESILNQTYKNLEIIIIDDGSTDNTKSIINRYPDDRLVFISRENKGLIYTLNEGIKKSRGDVIVRMDADDISRLDRIEKQLEYIYKGYDLIGSNVEFIDSEDLTFGHSNYPLERNEIIDYLLFNSPFAHPSVMGKREVFIDFYKNHHKYAEDYGLWVYSIFKRNIKVVNLKDCLLKYRIHTESVSRCNVINQINSCNEIRKEFISDNDIKKYYYNEPVFVLRDKNTNFLKFILSCLRLLIKKRSLGFTILVLRIINMQIKTMNEKAI